MFVWIENIEKNYTNSQVAGKQFSGLSGWAAAAAAAAVRTQEILHFHHLNMSLTRLLLASQYFYGLRDTILENLKTDHLFRIGQ